MTREQAEEILQRIESGQEVSVYGSEGQWGFRQRSGGMFYSFQYHPYDDPGDGEHELSREEALTALLVHDYQGMRDRLRGPTEPGKTSRAPLPEPGKTSLAPPPGHGAMTPASPPEPATCDEDAEEGARLWREANERRRRVSLELDGGWRGRIMSFAWTLVLILLFAVWAITWWAR